MTRRSGPVGGGRKGEPDDGVGTGGPLAADGEAGLDGARGGAELAGGCDATAAELTGPGGNGAAAVCAVHETPSPAASSSGMTGMIGGTPMRRRAGMPAIVTDGRAEQPRFDPCRRGSASLGLLLEAGARRLARSRASRFTSQTCRIPNRSSR